MNSFLNLSENAKIDFYQAKYNYYRLFNLGILSFAALFYFMMFVLDWRVSGQLTSFSFLLRLLFVIPLALVYFSDYKKSTYKVTSGLSFLALHALILGNIVIFFLQTDTLFINESFLFSGIIILLCSFSTPIFYALLSYLT
ncbi:MAG: hypothetical protein ACK5LG_23810 [Bacteroides thetaiotaomicron]